MAIPMLLLHEGMFYPAGVAQLAVFDEIIFGRPENGMVGAFIEGHK
jgi:hypothetical protein